MAELLKVENLVKDFPLARKFIFSGKDGKIRAVDNISFSIDEGETFGLVGESGSGKSTVARLILRLIKANRGKVFFEDEDIFYYSRRRIRYLRQKMQIIFQDPYSSLNPRMRVADIIGEPLQIYKRGDYREQERRVLELLEIVGLDSGASRKYPHQFSGGERQRIGIARALSLKPQFILCDEPVSALDVSIQAQIINLLLELQKEFNLTYLFISHDLNLVKYLCHRVAVMYLGKILELANKVSLYQAPFHPYTQALLSAVSLPDPRIKGRKKRIILKGDIPSPTDHPSGCCFHPRCPIAQEICAQKEPEFRQVRKKHWAACHFAKPNPIPN